MKVFNYSEARQQLSKLLDLALREEVIIRRRNGETFCLKRREELESPLDVPGIKTHVTTKDILAAVRATRARAR